MAKVDYEQSDFLGKIPDDILSSIISSICIRDVAKLRTISRRWRYVCPSNCNLEFDINSVLGGNVCKLPERKGKFVHGVSKCLKLYESQKINSLRISFPLEEEDTNHIDSWISFAFRAGAQKLLDLDFESISRCNNVYEFASPMLLCESKLFQLKDLRLTSCKLMPSPNLGGVFISLKRLNLAEVSLDNTSANTIISNGLNLEWLSLSSCDLPETLNVEGLLLHLKGLNFRDCQGVQQIDISCASLILFEYRGFEVIDLSFKDVPRLEKVHILFLRNFTKAFEYTYNMLPRDVPHLQHLSVSSITHRLLVPPTPLSITRFYHLKHLDLFLIHGGDKFNLLSVTFIFDAAPHLQKFCLSINKYCRQVPQQNYLDYVHYHLKEVEVHGFKGAGAANEMEFVMYLLKNALTLKEMILSRHTLSYFGGGSWRKGNEIFSDKDKQDVRDSLKACVGLISLFLRSTIFEMSS